MGARSYSALSPGRATLCEQQSPRHQTGTHCHPQMSTTNTCRLSGVLAGGLRRGLRRARRPRLCWQGAVQGWAPGNMLTTQPREAHIQASLTSSRVSHVALRNQASLLLLLRLCPTPRGPSWGQPRASCDSGPAPLSPAGAGHPGGHRAPQGSTGLKAARPAGAAEDLLVLRHGNRRGLAVEKQH